MRRYIIKFNLIILALAILFFSHISINSVKAEVFIPKTDREICELDSVIDVYFGEDCSAIIKNSTTLLISKDSEYIAHGNSFTSLKQVRRLDESHLIVSADAKLYTIDLKTNELKYFTNKSGDIITANSFDVNGDFMIKTFGTEATIYNLKKGTSAIVDSKISVDKPICIFNDYVYCIKDSEIKEIPFNKDQLTSGTERSICSANPDKMITDGNYIYFTVGNDIFKVSITEQTVTQLSFDKTEFQLDFVENVSAISFKGENLLIASQNTVQEFLVDNDKLISTGYNVAKNKTAFNRILENAIDIERFNNRIAVVDENKLTVILLEDFNAYDRQSFINVVFENTSPSFFALGKDGVLTYNGTLTYVNLINGNKTDITEIENVNDLTYQSGDFYALTDAGVFKINENDLTHEQISEERGISLTVDVYKNPHIYSETDEVVKACSDLFGNIYQLKNNGNLIYDGEILLSNIKSFTLNFDDGRVFYLKNNDSKIYYTNDISFGAITSLPVMQVNFFGDAKEFKSYTIKEGRENLANIYKVSFSETTNFNGLLKQEKEYVYIDAVDNTSLSLYASQNGLVLIDNKEVKEVIKENIAINKTVYLRTKARAYYLPIITKGNDYVSNEKTAIIEKGAEFNAEKLIEYLDVKFYFGTTVINGKTLICYVPKNFTTDSLYTQPENVFMLKNIKKAKVYANENLKEEIAELNFGTTVRVYEKNKRSTKIAYFDGENWNYGYVKSNRIIFENNQWIRNVLIVLAVFACISGSATYFILKIKNKEGQQDEKTNDSNV